MEKLTEKQKSVLTKLGELYLHFSRENAYSRSKVDYYLYSQIDVALTDLCEMLDIYFVVVYSNLSIRELGFFDKNDDMIFTVKESI